MDIASAIVGHVVGDYLLQNDYLAAGKKTSSAICAVHCLIWTSAVCLLSGYWNLTGVAILFGTHFIQDRTAIVRKWMRFAGQDGFATGPCAPWSIIVVDNAWHLVTIWVVGNYV